MFLTEQSLADTDYPDLSFVSVQCGEGDGVEGDGGGVIYDEPTNSLVVLLECCIRTMRVFWLS